MTADETSATSDQPAAPSRPPAASFSGLDAAQRDRLLALVRDVADWPVPGVVFKDLTWLFADPEAFAVVIDAMATLGRERQADMVVGIEARGFILGAPVAHALGVGFVPMRKHGKLPWRTVSADYALEYGTASIEVHADALSAGTRVLLVDDVLATGGTLAAAASLVRRCRAEVAAASVLMELKFLAGRGRMGDVDVMALLAI